jgi:hypothetical protein
MKWALLFYLHYLQWKIVINQGCISHVEGCKLQTINSCFIIYIYAWVPHNQNSPFANANCLVEKNYISIVIHEVLVEWFLLCHLEVWHFLLQRLCFHGQFHICGKCGSSMSHMPSSTWINNLIIGCGIGLSFQCCYVEHLFLIGVATMEHPICFIYLLFMTIF